jgi:hypothetical protein
MSGAAIYCANHQLWREAVPNLLPGRCACCPDIVGCGLQLMVISMTRFEHRLDRLGTRYYLRAATWTVIHLAYSSLIPSGSRLLLLQCLRCGEPPRTLNWWRCQNFGPLVGSGAGSHSRRFICSALQHCQHGELCEPSTQVSWRNHFFLRDPAAHVPMQARKWDEFLEMAMPIDFASPLLWCIRGTISLCEALLLMHFCRPKSGISSWGWRRC